MTVQLTPSCSKAAPCNTHHTPELPRPQVTPGSAALSVRLSSVLLPHSHWASTASQHEAHRGTRQSHCRHHTHTHTPPLHPLPPPLLSAATKHLDGNEEAMVLYPLPPPESSSPRSHTRAERKPRARTDGTSRLQSRPRTRCPGPCEDEGRDGRVRQTGLHSELQKAVRVGGGGGQGVSGGHRGTEGNTAISLVRTRALPNAQ